MLEITTFKWVPPFAQGYVRDFRVRWACEEVGLPYQVRFIGPEDQKLPSYRREQPFGQVPTLRDGDLILFETGSIVLYIAEKAKGLLPESPSARERVRTWVFAALNSVEPFVQNHIEAESSSAEDKERRAQSSSTLKKRLESLETWLADREFLENDFSAADLLMSSVLRDLSDMDILKTYAHVSNYRERCSARPGFKKALADQLRTFEDRS